MNTNRTKVLVTDDEKSIRVLLNDKLTQDGYQVIEASSGADGLAVFREERPPIVISDLKMAGMNGEDMIQEIKRIAPATITLILTGFGSLDSVIRMMEVGCDGYLLKPITNLDSIHLAITQAQQRQSMLLRNAALRKHAKNQSQAIQSLLEALFPPLSQMQENLTAMRVALEEQDYEELGELLDVIGIEMGGLGEILEESQSCSTE